MANVDGVSDAQGFNRYSYVGNNPMNATDPSGFFKLKEILPAVIGIIVAAVAIVTQQYYVLGKFTSFFSMLKGGIATLSGAMIGGAAGGFASGFSGSLLNGGSIGDAFKAGAIGAAVGAATAWAAHGIGNFFDDLGGAWADGTFNNWAGRTLAHATVGGAASAAQGGQFRHGFYSSAASTGFMHSRLGGRLMRNSHIAVRTATAAAIGGTASALGGGKFANGAVTSAFQHLFNQEATRKVTKTEVKAEEFMSGKRDGFYHATDRAKAKLLFGEYNDDRAVTNSTFAEKLGRAYLSEVDFVFVNSHGSGDGLWFGPFYVEGMPLLTVDSSAWQALVSKMKPGAAIVLDSCSSARSLAPALASKYNVTVYASENLTQMYVNTRGEIGWNDHLTDTPAKWYRFTPEK